VVSVTAIIETGAEIKRRSVCYRLSYLLTTQLLRDMQEALLLAADGPRDALSQSKSF